MTLPCAPRPGSVAAAACPLPAARSNNETAAPRCVRRFFTAAPGKGGQARVPVLHLELRLQLHRRIAEEDPSAADVGVGRHLLRLEHGVADRRVRAAEELTEE